MLLSLCFVVATADPLVVLQVALSSLSLEVPHAQSARLLLPGGTGLV